MKLVDKVQEEIKRMILEKKYDENGYLPSEGEFSELCSVSRATVREAVRAMEVRGFVKRVHGKGILVLDTSTQVLTQNIVDMIEKRDISMEDVLEVRRILETQAALLAADRITNEQKEALWDCVRAMEQYRLEEKEYAETEMHFHELLIDAAGNALLSSIAKVYMPWVNRVIHTSLGNTIKSEREHHYHMLIVQALEKCDKKSIQKAMETHFCSSEKTVRE